MNSRTAYAGIMAILLSCSSAQPILAAENNLELQFQNRADHALSDYSAAETETGYSISSTTAPDTANENGPADLLQSHKTRAEIDVQAELERLKAVYIPAGSSQYQILEGAARIAASFDYGTEASSWSGMIRNGSGDCWASTSMIIKICEDYGMQVKARPADRDPGAGGGHMNVIARADDSLYVADAGYAGTAPRFYSLSPTDGFSYSGDSSGWIIYQYDGFDQDISIPAAAAGWNIPITGLDLRVFGAGITAVTVPDSIQSIRSMYSDGETVLFGTFSRANDLQDIRVDPNNAFYCDQDGVLFSKDRKTLLQFPAGRSGSYVIPDGTETIASGAFCQSKLTELYLPSSIHRVDDYAFIDCELKTLSFQGERPDFGVDCFWLSDVTIHSDNPWQGMDSFDFGLGKVQYVSSPVGQPPQQPSAQPVLMNRLYNPNSGEHFYTADLNEKEYLARIGWKDEGIGWKAPSRSAHPVYRLYNANAGDHHYTMSVRERDALISYGWKDEGTGWYSDENQGVPLYRQYNPNAKTGSHNYTIDLRENDYLAGLGWMTEGISWYGLK